MGMSELALVTRRAEMSNKPKIIVGCECSGVVRAAFANIGWDAVSVDLEPDESGLPGEHWQADVFDALDRVGRVNLCIIHPPCQYLCSSGLHWNKRRPERAILTEKALDFAIRLWETACKKADSVCMENSIGCLSTRFRYPDQIIQPHQFGEDASKATCLWLKNLPDLVPTKHVAPRIVGGRPRWANQTDSGQNRLPPSSHRAADRARTYPGVSRVMAEQWGLTIRV